MKNPVIENWEIVFRYESAYAAPEQGVMVFKGNVYNSSTFEDGEPILTTEIVGYCNEVFKTISGSKYSLGKPNLSESGLLGAMSLLSKKLGISIVFPLQKNNK